MLNANSILTRGAHASYEVVADEAIIIDINTGTYFSLNKIGTEFWQMLDGKQTIVQHAVAIANKYAVDAAMVTDDMLEVAQQMDNDNLVLVAS